MFLHRGGLSAEWKRSPHARSEQARRLLYFGLANVRAPVHEFAFDRARLRSKTL